MKENPKQRYLKNYFLMPRLQLMIAVSLLAITIIFLWVSSRYFDIAFRDLFNVLIESSSVSEELRIQLESQTNQFRSIMFVIFLVYAFVSSFIVAVFTHRIIGPSIPIKRHVSNLLKGQFDSRVILRKKDCFNELAENLNQLAEKLSKGEK